MVENRQYDFGAGQWRLFEQYVWGLQYIDELVQVGVDPEPVGRVRASCPRRIRYNPIACGFW